MNPPCNHARWLLLPLAAALAGCGVSASESWQRTGDSVVVHPVADGAAAVRLQVVGDDIIRVTAAPDGKFERSESLMRVARDGAAPAFEVAEADGKLRISAAGISAEVSTGDGQVAFFDASGDPLVSEIAGGRSFEAVEFEGKPYYSIRQRFESPGDEALDRKSVM